MALAKSAFMQSQRASLRQVAARSKLVLAAVLRNDCPKHSPTLSRGCGHAPARQIAAVPTFCTTAGMGTARHLRRYPITSQATGVHHMDREHVKGAADKVKGAIKDTAGKVTGDKQLQSEGKFDKAKGAAHNALGDAKDAIRKAVD
jgi:uncharacterized protein YjbJ (UPF0337 family)